MPIGKVHIRFRCGYSRHIAGVSAGVSAGWRRLGSAGKRVLQRLVIEARPNCWVMISSAATQRGPMGTADYIAAKAGLLGMMRTMARELSRHEIRVNCVLPGNVNTDLKIGRAHV